MRGIGLYKGEPVAVSLARYKWLRGLTLILTMIRGQLVRLVKKSPLNVAQSYVKISKFEIRKVSCPISPTAHNSTNPGNP